MAHPRDHGMLGGHPTRPHRECPEGILELLCGDDDGCDVCHRSVAWAVRPNERLVPPGVAITWYLTARPGDYRDPDDGVFRETTRAAANVRYGRQPRLRRPPRRIRERGFSLSATDPLVVRCSLCDTEHTLHAAAMGLAVPEPYDD